MWKNNILNNWPEQCIQAEKKSLLTWSHFPCTTTNFKPILSTAWRSYCLFPVHSSNTCRCLFQTSCSILNPPTPPASYLLQKKTSTSSHSLPISTCPLMICLPATIKDELSMFLGKSTHPRAQYIPPSHTNAKIIAPLVTSFALYWIIMSSLSTGSFPSVYKHVITSLILKRKFILNPTSASSCRSISLWNQIRSLSFSLKKICSYQSPQWPPPAATVGTWEAIKCQLNIPLRSCKRQRVFP